MPKNTETRVYRVIFGKESLQFFMLTKLNKGRYVSGETYGKVRKINDEKKIQGGYKYMDSN